MPLHCELRLTNGWDPLASLGHPNIFQRVTCLGSVTARHYSSGPQPNFVALNRGCHLYSAGRPSRWAVAHILVIIIKQKLCVCAARWCATRRWLVLSFVTTTISSSTAVTCRRRRRCSARSAYFSPSSTSSASSSREYSSSRSGRRRRKDDID